MNIANWPVRLSASAESDYREILRWTLAHFGETQAQVYADTLAAALKELTTGPMVPGVRDRGDIGKGILTLHVARNGRKGRHFLMFRANNSDGAKSIDVLRLLHDAMDMQRHLPPS